MKNLFKAFGLFSATVMYVIMCFGIFSFFVNLEFDDPEPPAGIYLENGGYGNSPAVRYSKMEWAEIKFFLFIGKAVSYSIVYVPALIGLLFSFSTLIGKDNNP